MHMGMAATNENKILSDWNRLLHLVFMPQCRLKDEQRVKAA